MPGLGRRKKPTAVKKKVDGGETPVQEEVPGDGSSASTDPRSGHDDPQTPRHDASEVEAAQAGTPSPVETAAPARSPPAASSPDGASTPAPTPSSKKGGDKTVDKMPDDAATAMALKRIEMEELFNKAGNGNTKSKDDMWRVVRDHLRECDIDWEVPDDITCLKNKWSNMLSGTFTHTHCNTHTHTHIHTHTHTHSCPVPLGQV